MLTRRSTARPPQRARARVVATAAIALSLLVTALLPASEARRRDRRQPPSAAELDEETKFGAEMALEGLWREALYRWERVLVHRPDDPLLLNNVAVAREALGRTDAAREAYEAALRLSGETEIATNVAYFEQAEARRQSEGGAGKNDEPRPAAPDAGESEPR